jgi:hypothetical protein
MSDTQLIDLTEDQKYARIKDLKSIIAILTEELSDLETELGATQKDKVVTVPGVGRFERFRTSAKETYDHDRLKAQVIRVAREERIATDDGEIIEDPVERTMFVISKAASFSWRVGDKKNPTNPEKPGLIRFGIEADQFREKEKGILKVKLIAGDVAEGGE